MNPNLLADGVAWYVVFVFSLTCHEAVHALVAKWGGDQTAALGGQVTLNPIPHMRREIFGTVIIPILSYALGGWMIGWASAPYDPSWRRRYPRRAAWMALAGPLANFALVLVAALSIRLCLYAGFLKAPESVQFTKVVAGSGAGASDGLAMLLSIMFSLNLLLATFNLLPIPPLDGNTAVGLLLSQERARRFTELTRNRTLALVGLIVCWKIFPYIFAPVFGLALNLIYL